MDVVSTLMKEVVEAISSVAVESYDVEYCVSEMVVETYG